MLRFLLTMCTNSTDAKHHFNPNRSKHQKTARNGIWLLFGGLMVFGLVIVRFNVPEHNEVRLTDTGMPDSEQAYTIARQFIHDQSGKYLRFTANSYQFEQKADSIYTVKTNVESQEGDNSSITFSVVLKYKGGSSDDRANWMLLDINQK